MRVYLSNVELYVFKDRYYVRPVRYYNMPQTTVADKYFRQEVMMSSKNIMTMVEILMNSTKIEELEEAPRVVSANLEEQLADLLSYLKHHFDIGMDERNRFYTEIKMYVKSRKNKLFQKEFKTKRLYFSFEEVMQIYSLPHHRFKIDFNEDFKNESMNKSKYIEEKRAFLNNSYTINKKYRYLTIKRKRKLGFVVTDPDVVTLPK